MIGTTRFAYRAARADGALERGVVAAADREAAVRALSSQGLWTLEMSAAASIKALGGRLSVADLALGLRVLATLLDSGLPVSKALSAMPELAPEAWAPALPDLARAVREGESLGTALDQSGLSIPAVVLGIVRAGEAGSGLAPAVRRAADLMEETAATRSALRAALVYPCILALAGTISVAILVGIVLPGLPRFCPTSVRRCPKPPVSCSKRLSLLDLSHFPQASRHSLSMLCGAPGSRPLPARSNGMTRCSPCRWSAISADRPPLPAPVRLSRRSSRAACRCLTH